MRCGDLGRIVTLHGECYEQLPGFGLRFEAYVAKTIAEYILDNEGQGRVWLAERGDSLVGCTAIALREHDRGQLRWVLVDPEARGIGLGRELVETALAYCRDKGCVEVFLESTDGLPESQALYDKLGFELTSSVEAKLWSGTRTLIRMHKKMESAPSH